MAQAGHPVFDADGILQKGVILRHLALPGHVKDSFAVLDQMAAWNDADPGCFLPSRHEPVHSLLQGRRARHRAAHHHLRIPPGGQLRHGSGPQFWYMQQKSSAKEEYTPSFDLTGV